MESEEEVWLHRELTTLPKNFRLKIPLVDTEVEKEILEKVAASNYSEKVVQNLLVLVVALDLLGEHIRGLRPWKLSIGINNTKQ